MFVDVLFAHVCRHLLEYQDQAIPLQGDRCGTFSCTALFTNHARQALLIFHGLVLRTDDHLALAGVGGLLVGVVGAAHQRPALDVLEAQSDAVLFQFRELFGRVVAAHRQVVLRRPEVLADGQDVHLVLAQVAHGVVELLLYLAQAHHEATLREPFGVELLGEAQHLQRAAILRLRADSWVEARDGLDVVIEGVGTGVHDGLYRFAVALEVGGEDLDGAARDFGADRAYRPGEDGGPAIREFIAIHAGDHGVLEAHLLCGVGDAVGLVEVELGGLAGQNGAEPARAGADVAEDHEGRRAVVPTLPDVRAAGLLADGVEVQAAHGLLDVPVHLAIRDPRLEPVGTAVRARGAALLLPEGQVLRRYPIRRRGHRPVLPAVADLKGLRAVV